MEIVDLKTAPHYFDVIADRIWNAWWKPSGAELADVEAALTDVVSSDVFPFTLVCAEGEVFVGTVTCIATDIEARPELGPCVAALWVEPDRRGRGVADRLVDAALLRLHAAGYEHAYLAARRPLRDYYSGRGWVLAEQGVGADQLDVFNRVLGEGAAYAIDTN